MEWPIFFRENLKLGNMDSSVGICTLWTRKENVHDNIPESKYAVCGNLYTIQGINPMIKNILANPKIRYMVLCGADLMKSGDALVNLMKHGIDSNRKIVNSAGHIDSNIDEKLVESFRKGVQLIDMRGKEKEVPETVSKLKTMPPFAKPVRIVEEEPTFASTYSDELAYRVSANSIPDGWLKVLDIVMKFGEDKPSEYGIKQKEVVNMVCVIENDDGKIPEWMSIAESELESYYSGFFSDKKDSGVSYTYGERLFKYPIADVEKQFGKEAAETYNQISQVIKKLKEFPYTRRAIAFTWNLKLDAQSTSPPCLTQITWNIKHGRLCQTAIFRSHDMFGAWPLNVFALRRLQAEVARQVGVTIGQLTIISNSAHVYENNWKQCKGTLDGNYKGKLTHFEQDKNGYFIVSVENGEIVVQHHTMDGQKSEHVFRGTKAQMLYRQIVHANLFSKFDHAAYIGHELARAEIALKEGKKFVQDEA